MRSNVLSRRPHVLLFIVVGAVLVPAACTGPQEELKGFPFPPNPLSVAVTLDEDRAAAEVITSEGGMVSAVGHDGTTYSLVFPPDALLSPQKISLTPVVEIEGLPLSGGVTAAVHIQPDGLRLSAPATLVIVTEQALGRSGMIPIGFGYHGRGEEFHLFPSVVTENSAEFQLMHFSGYGTGAGTKEDLDKQRQRAPTSPQDQAKQESAADRTAARLRSILQSTWRSIVQPELLNAQADAEAHLDVAYHLYISWVQDVRNAGEEHTFKDTIEEGAQLVAAALLAALDDAHQKCVFRNQPSQVVRMMRWMKWGLSNRDVFWRVHPELEAFRYKAAECARFELNFSSRMDSIDSDFHIWQHVEARVPLIMVNWSAEPGHTYKFEGSGTLEFTGLGWNQGPPCVVTYTGSPTDFSVRELTVNLDLVAHFGSASGSSWADDVREVRLVLEEPAAFEKLRIDCPDESTTFHESAHWNLFFRALHEGKIDLLNYSYVFTDWQRGTGDVYARLDSTLSDPTLPVVEETQLELRHTPRR